ncbi:major capsid protein [Thioclava pacifica]|uniref:Elements of external origin n=1 Tax=Thioclava pacifica DSM 10166 TaxID=1353537 RepID=A0A074JC30_9RHOB|nr:major capsid protein [Thioclava pacifica]KEO53410.1 hypothetical protein TP2_17930 [Thioclava pacifica DSM 10166]
MTVSFSDPAFSVSTLSALVNEENFVPSRIEKLGIFRSKPISTTKTAIEKKNGELKLVPPSPRGGPGSTVKDGKRSLVELAVPHFEVNDAFYAESIQDKREFGTEATLKSVTVAVYEKMLAARNNLLATEEHARMGAIKGVVTYADGSSLNLYDELEVTAPDKTWLDLSNSAATDGALRRACSGVVRKIMDKLGAYPMTGVHAFCGDTFFDDLITHPEVRETYRGTSEAAFLRSGYVNEEAPGAYAAFSFGGIIFENYRGGADATFVAPTECRVFPLGVPDLFISAYAPADYMETVNTEGERFTAKIRQMANEKGANIDVQMNALQYCSRPELLFELSSEADPAA